MSTVTVYTTSNCSLDINADVHSQTQTLQVTLSRKDEIACRDPPARVRSNIYIGSNASIHISTLQRLGITHVLIAACELAPAFPDQLQYLQLSLSDTDDDDLVTLFPTAFDFIEAGRKAGWFVCCSPVATSAACCLGMTHRAISAAALAACFRPSERLCCHNNNSETVLLIGHACLQAMLSKRH
jgi:hypothetical protein